MPKRKLTEIADEMGISFDKALEVSSLHLDESMVTGRGKNTWINEEGQDIMDTSIPVAQIYRGRVLSVCPNPRFSYVYIKEMLRKVPIIMPKTNARRKCSWQVCLYRSRQQRRRT